MLHDMIKDAHNLQGFSSFRQRENFKAGFSLSRNTKWAGQKWHLHSWIFYYFLFPKNNRSNMTCYIRYIPIGGRRTGIKVTRTKHYLLEGCINLC